MFKATFAAQRLIESIDALRELKNECRLDNSVWSRSHLNRRTAFYLSPKSKQRFWWFLDFSISCFPNHPMFLYIYLILTQILIVHDIIIMFFAAFSLLLQKLDSKLFSESVSRIEHA